jgi:hypothetical protein
MGRNTDRISVVAGVFLVLLSSIRFRTLARHQAYESHRRIGRRLQGYIAIDLPHACKGDVQAIAFVQTLVDVSEFR